MSSSALFVQNLSQTMIDDRPGVDQLSLGVRTYTFFLSHFFVIVSLFGHCLVKRFCQLFKIAFSGRPYPLLPAPLCTMRTFATGIDLASIFQVRNNDRSLPINVFLIAQGRTAHLSPAIWVHSHSFMTPNNFVIVSINWDPADQLQESKTLPRLEKSKRALRRTSPGSLRGVPA